MLSERRHLSLSLECYLRDVNTSLQFAETRDDPSANFGQRLVAQADGNQHQHE